MITTESKNKVRHGDYDRWVHTQVHTDGSYADICDCGHDIDDHEHITGTTGYVCTDHYQCPDGQVTRR